MRGLQMKKMLFFLLLLCFSASVYPRHAQDTMFIIRPDLTRAVIGFDITPEEEQEFCDYIIKELSKAFRASLAVVKSTDLGNLAGEKDPVLYFLITDAHTIYRIQGAHSFEVSSVLYKFQPGDMESGPVVYATPHIFGQGGWGKNNPFESALRTNMNGLTYKIRNKKTSGFAGRISLDSLVREERFIECDKKALAPSF
jgi:hypothetical protein